MDFLIFGFSVFLFAAVLYGLCSFPQNAGEGMDLCFREKDLGALKAVISASNMIVALSLIFFFVCCFIIGSIWDNLQRNMIQKFGLWIFVVTAFLLLIMTWRAYLIRKKALNAYHSLCENSIVDAQVEKKQNGVWICKFILYQREHRGYLEEKPSAEKIKISVLKYKSRKRMYLLKELH